MTDRDTFAAAALTGLLARGLLQSNLLAADAYKVADAMLRERCRAGADCPGQDNAPSHDAAPAARASVESVAPQPTTRGDSDRTDKAAPRPSQGTGDTPKPIKGGVSDRSKPINGPDPDSRVWETPVHTPATHATRGEGSVRREGTEPVAWATFYPNGSAASVYVGRQPQHAEPLYRQPPCQDFSQKNLTLTDAEAETLRELRDEAAQYADEIGLCASEVRVRQRIIDGLLRRLGGEK